MRILHVVASPDAVTGGGLIERTLHLARALQSAGATCAVLTLDIGLDEARRRDFSGIGLHVLPCLNRRFYVPAAMPDRLRRIVGTADVVELTGHWTLLNAMVGAVARRLGKPYLFRPAGALGLVGRSVALKRLYNYGLGYSLIRHAAGHVAVTTGEMGEYEQYGIRPDKLTVIPNGIDLPTQETPDCRGFLVRHGLVGRRLVLFVGRLSHIKGPDLLLEAFVAVAHEMPDFDLVFAGPDDGLRPALERQAEERGVAGRVHFLGYVTGADKACAYVTSAFLVLPSRREAMSIVALEAGAHGKPVLLTDQCGFDDVQRCGGGLVVSATAAGIAGGLRELTSRGDQLDGMGAALRAYVGAHYTWGKAAAAFLALCEEALRAREHATA